MVRIVLRLFSSAITALLVAGLLLSIAAASFDFGAQNFRFDPMPMLSFVLLAFPILMIIHNRTTQLERDLRANIVARRLRNRESAPPFFLFLRPFRSKAIAHVPFSLSRLISQIDSGRTTLEGQLLSSLQDATVHILASVAVGVPQDGIGAGRAVASNQNWKDLVRTASERAQLIILIVSSRVGTSWEIDLILSHGWERKTVFIIPPKKLVAIGSTYEPQQDYAGATSLFGRYGYVLPAYHGGGAAFAFNKPNETIVEPFDFPNNSAQTSVALFRVIEKSDNMSIFKIKSTPEDNRLYWVGLISALVFMITFGLVGFELVLNYQQNSASDYSDPDYLLRDILRGVD